jgi:hypothetical protein
MKRGSDLNRMLPALAAYMGLSDLSSTERFLKLTPERFRKTVAKLSPKKSRKRWRDDPELMRFLHATLKGSHLPEREECVWQVFLAHLWQLTLAHLWQFADQGGMEKRWASG